MTWCYNVDIWCFYFGFDVNIFECLDSYETGNLELLCNVDLMLTWGPGPVETNESTILQPRGKHAWSII